MCGNIAERHRRCPKGQRRSNYHNARCLIDDDRFERSEVKCANKQRQPEFSPAPPYQAAQRSDNRPAAEHRRFVVPHVYLNSFRSYAQNMPGSQ